MAEWEVTLSTNDILPESSLDNLKREVPTEFPNYALGLPNYSKLNGQYENVIQVDTGNIGYVSNSVSDASGLFTTNPEITLTYVRRKICKGVKLIFNRHSGDYCSHLKIEWLLKGKSVYAAEFHPDAAGYYCKADVPLFTEIKITFLQTSKPYRRIWLAYLEPYRLLSGPGLVIDYYDVAYMAKEHTSLATDDAAAYSDTSLLLSNTIGTYRNYSPCLPRYAKLDGQWVNAPDDMNGMFFTSKQISGADGVFTDPPTLTATCSEVISSVGIELFFNAASGDYCSGVTIAWYRDSTLIHSEAFTPDGTDYFCSYQCQNYNRIVLTFTKTSKPYRYAFLTGFYFGVKRTLTTKQITKCRTFMEIASIGESLPECTLQFSLRNDGLPFIFEKSQDLLVSFDGQPICHYYLTTGERSSKVDYSIKAADIKQILEGKTHVGGFYSAANVKDVIEKEFFDGVEVEVIVDDSVASRTITGWLPYGNCRDNLAQILFAIGAIMDTSFDDGVYIYAYDSTLSARSITEDMIYSNATKIKTGDPFTGVEVVSHAWAKKSDVQEIYSGNLSGSATVVFNTPMHDLLISGGTIKESGVNYAVISGTGAVKLTGQSYEDTGTPYFRNNPIAYRNHKIAKAADSTLVTDANITEVLNRVYDYYILNKSITASILIGNIELSNIVSIDTFEGAHRGIVTALNMSYYGDVKAEATIKCLT